MAARPSSAMPASNATAVAGPKRAAAVAARAGPSTAALLKLAASSALARRSSAGGTSSGIMLVMPPVSIGAPIPAATASAGTTHAGVLPAASSMPTRAAASSTWLAARAARRCLVRSSQAPSTGPVSTLGRLAAATVAPASAGLDERSSTSSTTAIASISPATRPSVAAR